MRNMNACMWRSMSAMKSRPSLPVCGCSRREVLQGIGAFALLAACGSSSQPSAASTMCGSNICIDLADPANKALTTVGGAMIVDAASDTIMVIRTGDTTVAAVSAICTHAGCECTYNSSAKQLDCPCHGSTFTTSGTVVNGPARRPLAVYAATLSGTTITVTP